MKSFRPILILATVLSLYGSARAATYYVDFDGGNDSAAGSSPDQAWKDCPGDPAAKDKAKAAKLSPGDTVLFKGGVVYYGEIAVTSSGEKDKPIAFDGNSGGKFGAGRAIIDGSAPVAGWKHVASAEEVKGNPNWKEIYYADVPGSADWKTFCLSSEEGLLPVSQMPKMTDPFFQETVREFYETAEKVGTTFPGKVYFEEGSRGDNQVPLQGILTGDRAVVQPLPGGAFSIELDNQVTIASIGIKILDKYPVVKEMAIFGDGKELSTVTLDKDQTKDFQKFNLPSPATVKKLTFKLISTGEGEKAKWTKLGQVAAWTEADGKGTNVLSPPQGLMTVLTDSKNLTQTDPHHYDGMTVGIHGGNNWVFFQEVKKFDPATHQLYSTLMKEGLYKTTRYCLYNSVRLIERPGEYAIEPATDSKSSRVFLLPQKIKDDQPARIGYGARSNGFTLTEASHVTLKGFTIRRQGRGTTSGIKAKGGADLAFVDCEITGIVGSPGLGADNVDGIVVEKCHIHHCGGPDCRGMVLYHCKNASTRFCRIVKNTGTAVDYYGCVDSECRDNFVSDSLGMHANGLTFYVGNKNVVVERNVVLNSNVGLTFSEGTENIIVRNNLVDSGNKSFCVGIWPAGVFRNVQFLHNTFVRSDPNANWMAGVFSNHAAAGMEDIVFRNNIIDGTSGPVPAVYEHDLYTRLGDNQKNQKLGPGEAYEPDLSKIFVGPEKGDFHLKPGSPAIGAGMDAGVKDDVTGTKRPEGKAPDIGAYQYK